MVYELPFLPGGAAGTPTQLGPTDAYKKPVRLALDPLGAVPDDEGAGPAGRSAPAWMRSVYICTRSRTGTRIRLRADGWPSASLTRAGQDYNDPEKANAMARDTYHQLREYQRITTGQSVPGRWDEMKNLVDRFDRARSSSDNPTVRAIEGTYRGKRVTHFVDANTGLNVIADQSGKFVSGWRLGAEHLQSVLTTGRLF